MNATPSQAEIDQKRAELLAHHVRTAKLADLTEAIGEATNDTMIYRGRRRPMEDIIVNALQSSDLQALGDAIYIQFCYYTDTGIVERELQDWIDDYATRHQLTEEERERDDNVFNVETQS